MVVGIGSAVTRGGSWGDVSRGRTCGGRVLTGRRFFGEGGLLFMLSILRGYIYEYTDDYNNN